MVFECQINPLIVCFCFSRHYMTINMCTLKNHIHMSTVSVHFKLVPPYRLYVLPLKHREHQQGQGQMLRDVGLAHSQHSNSSWRCALGFRSGLCVGQSSSSTPDSVNHFFMDPALYTQFSWLSLNVAALRFKGPFIIMASTCLRSCSALCISHTCFISLF